MSKIKAYRDCFPQGSQSYLMWDGILTAYTGYYDNVRNLLTPAEDAHTANTENFYTAGVDIVDARNLIGQCDLDSIIQANHYLDNAQQALDLLDQGLDIFFNVYPQLQSAVTDFNEYIKSIQPLLDTIPENGQCVGQAG